MTTSSLQASLSLKLQFRAIASIVLLMALLVAPSHAEPFFNIPSPTRQVLQPGQSLSLTVNAIGLGTLSYQWYRNNRAISGATSPTYTNNSLRIDDCGAYTASVTDNTATKWTDAIFVLVTPQSTQLLSWGDKQDGATTIPAGLTNVVAVSAGGSHALALKADGTVVAWGSNTNKESIVPDGLTNVVAVSAGMGHSVVLKADGTILSWGNLRGTPNSLTNVVAISAGGAFLMALKSDGTVFAFGDNSKGQATVPPGLKNVIAVSAGGNHAAALKSDGTVVTWGDNTADQTTSVNNLTNVKALSSNFLSTMALVSDGTVVPEKNGWTVPADLKDVIAIAEGGDFSMALKSNRTIVAWGYDYEGQTVVPSGTANVLEFAAGMHFSLALCDTSGSTVPTISSQAGNQSVSTGGNVSFTAAASGTPAPSYQWQLNTDGGSTWTNIINAAPYSGATTASLSITGATIAMNSYQYRCVASNYLASINSNAATLTVAIAPIISSQPTAQAVNAGQALTLSVQASGVAPLSYQWYKDGSAIAGATASTLNLAYVKASDAGKYTVRITNSGGGTTESTAAEVTVATSRLSALAVRTESGPGADVLTVGIAVMGSSVSEKKQVIVRGVGPGLQKDGISNYLSDPEARVYSAAGMVASNDNWDDVTMKPILAGVSLDNLTKGSKDAAMLAQFTDGGYSIQVGAKTEERGIALAEIYESDSTTTSHMYAMSVRAKAGTQEKTLIGGFVIKGAATKRLVIRGLGPALAGALGSGYLADPKLEVYSAGAVIASNDNWGNTPELLAAFASVGLAPMEANSKDAALVVDLPPGAYSVFLTGVNNTTGIGLIEIYELP